MSENVIAKEGLLALAGLCTVLAQQAQTNGPTLVADGVALADKGVDALDAAAKTVVDNATPGPLKFLDGEFNAFVDNLDTTAKGDLPALSSAGLSWIVKLLTNEAASLTAQANAS